MDGEDAELVNVNVAGSAIGAIVEGEFVINPPSAAAGV